MKLIIESVPPVGLSYPILLSVGVERKALSQANSAVSIILDNSRGTLTELFQVQPYGAIAKLYDDEGLFFTGTVDSVDIGQQITIGLLSLVNQNLPLRRATELPKYRDDRILPLVYGTVSLDPLPLDTQNLEYLLADHPISGVVSVQVDGKATSGWQFLNRLDDTGNPVSVLRLTQPPESSIRVTLTGKMDEQTGEVMTHPADIAADLMRQSGMDIPVYAFQGLRDDYPGLELGIVFDEQQSLLSAISAVLDPIGAVWRLDNLSAWKPGTDDVIRLVIYQCNEENSISAVAEAGNEYQAAQVNYNYDWHEGRYRGSLMLSTGEEGKTLTVDLPAIRKARDALAIGTERLQDAARVKWTISGTVHNRNAINIGDRVKISHPYAPKGIALVTETAHSTEQQLVQFSAVMYMGQPPSVDLLLSGQAIDQIADDGLQVAYSNGVATFTIRDMTGSALAMAAVTLDDQETRYTDSRGVVQFKTTRGPHTLFIYLDGYDPIESEVVV